MHMRFVEHAKCTKGCGTNLLTCQLSLQLLHSHFQLVDRALRLTRHVTRGFRPRPFLKQRIPETIDLLLLLRLTTHCLAQQLAEICSLGVVGRSPCHVCRHANISRAPTSDKASASGYYRHVLEVSQETF